MLLTGSRKELDTLVDRIIAKRDLRWTRAIGVCDKALTPEEGAEWLKADRITRARNVSDARQRRGPVHY
jgi:hypothetical protein